MSQAWFTGGAEVTWLTRREVNSRFALGAGLFSFRLKNIFFKEKNRNGVLPADIHHLTATEWRHTEWKVWPWQPKCSSDTTLQVKGSLSNKWSKANWARERVLVPLITIFPQAPIQLVSVSTPPRSSTNFREWLWIPLKKAKNCNENNVFFWEWGSPQFDQEKCTRRNPWSIPLVSKYNEGKEQKYSLQQQS